MSNVFGGWSIEKKLFDWMCENLDYGKRMLEFGSGWASEELNQFWELYSIEHDPAWLFQTSSRYFYVPLNGKNKNSDYDWYDAKVLDAVLNRGVPNYSYVLVDAPKGEARPQIINYTKWLNRKATFILDDVDSKHLKNFPYQLGEVLGREPEIHDGNKKQFAVI